MKVNDLYYKKYLKYKIKYLNLKLLFGGGKPRKLPSLENAPQPNLGDGKLNRA